VGVDVRGREGWGAEHGAATTSVLQLENPSESPKQQP
jgi:hypothetical protein